MRPRRVVIQSPGLDDGARFAQRGELMFVEALVTEAAAEALDVGVLGRLVGLDVMQTHAPIACPAEHRDAS